MKILLISNYQAPNRGHFPTLRQTLAGHDIVLQTYRPGIEFQQDDKDLIVLSGGGGEGQEINDVYHDKLWYEDQMKFILSTKTPIIGICMGFEVIARAYGQKVEELSQTIEGFQKLKTTKRGKRQLGSQYLVQDQTHSWGITGLPAGFEALAESPDCIEVIKHKTKPIFATQFHPESEGGSLELKQLIRNHNALLARA